MDLYPDNKVSQWKTKLSEFVELQCKWEVGLLEVSFPGKVCNIYGNHYYLIVGGLNPNMTIVLGDGTYDTIHLVIGEIQRSFVAAALANNLPEDRAVIQSSTLIVTDASKFSLPTTPTRAIGCTSAMTWQRCSASSRIGTTGSGVRTLKTRFMLNDRYS